MRQLKFKFSTKWYDPEAYKLQVAKDIAPIAREQICRVSVNALINRREPWESWPNEDLAGLLNRPVVTSKRVSSSEKSSHGEIKVY